MEQLARFLEQEYESAARSPREGLKKMFPLQRLEPRLSHPRPHRITYRPAEKTKSEPYLEFIPKFNAGRAESARHSAAGGAAGWAGAKEGAWW